MEVSEQTLWNWRAGKLRPPLWAAERLLAMCEDLHARVTASVIELREDAVRARMYAVEKHHQQLAAAHRSAMLGRFRAAERRAAGVIPPDRGAADPE